MHEALLATVASMIFMSCNAMWMSPDLVTTGHLRFKRGSNAGHVDHCTINCLIEMDDRFNETFGSEEQPDTLQDKYDEEKFDKLCRAYEPSSQCLKSCPESTFRKTILGSFDTLEFMCITNEDDVKSYMPCIDQNRESWENSCDPDCKSLEQALKKWSNMQANSKSDVKEMKQMFSDTCSYIKCESSCSQNTLSNLCGEEAKDFMGAFWNSVVNALNNATELTNQLIDDKSMDKKMPICDFALTTEA